MVKRGELSAKKGSGVEKLWSTPPKYNPITNAYANQYIGVGCKMGKSEITKRAVRDSVRGNFKPHL